MAETLLIEKVEVEDIKELRFKVLWPHKSGVQACEIEPDRFLSTFHIGAWLDNQLVGTSTFIVDINPQFDDEKQYRLRAMATDPSVRGVGVGAKIIEAGIEVLKEKNVHLLWCDARLVATGFYEKMGFEVLGEIYEVPQIGPHKLMYKVLK